MGDPAIQAKIAETRAQIAALKARKAAAGGAPGGGGAQAPGGHADYAAADQDAIAQEAAANPPVITEQEPDMAGIAHRGQAALYGLDRSFTGGMLTSLADKVDPGTRGRMEAAREQYPEWALGGGLLGAGAPGSLARGVAKGAGALLGTGYTAAKTGLAGAMGRGALVGGAGAGAQSGIEAAVAGEDVGAAVERGTGLGAVLGPFGGALQWAGNKASAAIRDPRQPLGRDINSAAAIGTEPEASLRGVKPGQAYEEATESAVKAGGTHSQTAIAAEKNAPVLGEAVQGKMSSTLGGFGPLGDTERATLQPVLAKQMQLISKATQDNQLLPGQNVRDVVGEMRKTANVQVVPRTSDIAHDADPANMMDVGLARHIGLVKGGANSGDAESVVILTPRSVNAEKLETVRRGFDVKGGAIGDYKQAGSPANAKAQASAAREAREGLGPEHVAEMARRSEALRGMKNTQQAAGLPREADGVSMGELDTDKALHDAMLRYRSGDASLPADRLLDKLAETDPRLRAALDNQAGVSATQRLMGHAEVPLNAGGVGSYGLKDAAKLRADPMMRYLGVHGNVLTPGVAAAGSRERR